MHKNAFFFKYNPKKDIKSCFESFFTLKLDLTLFYVYIKIEMTE